MSSNNKRKEIPAEVDIIPIIDIDNKNEKTANNFNMSGIDEPKTMPNIKYIASPHDPHLIARVKEFLELNAEQRQVDIVEMADYLQAKYREYTRRKRRPFQAYVKNAYEMLLDEYKRQNVTTSWSDDEDDEEDDDDVIENDNSRSNHLNDGLMKLYQQKLVPQGETINITISSDEDEETLENVDPKKSDNNGSEASIKSTDREPGEIPRGFCNFDNKNLKVKVIEKVPPSNKEVDNRKRKLPLSTLNQTPAKRKRDLNIVDSKTTFNDVGGIDNILEDVCKLLVHIKYPEIYRQIGVTPPRGFLLHGPPGCGKSLLANAIAGELSVPLLKVAAPELVAGISGESEERIRNLFEQAAEIAPCVLFIDEVDAITPNREQAQREMERRIVAQLLSCLDDLTQHENGDRVLVIGATNRPDAIDPALRRAGRFDREVTMGIPDTKARANILRVLCKSLKLESDFDYNALALLTPGFVGADLMSLVREAAMVAVDRVIKDLKAKPTESVDDVVSASTSVVENGEEAKESEPKVPVVQENKDVNNENVATSSSVDEIQKSRSDELVEWLHSSAQLTEEQLSAVHIESTDFQKALSSVQPSAKREGFATVPGVTWDDVGSLIEIREELKLAILAPVRHADQFEAMGLTTPTGVLLCGPPGCGKTLLAKAIANEAGVNFISVKGPELLNMYVGESERAVRLCFQRARNSAPCVIFFDELDALCPKRSENNESGASMRVVNQMLTEMDGVEGRRGVFLMAASNRPEIIDPAVLRPGRFDKILYVGLPTASDRVDILRAVTKNGTRPKLALDVNLELIGRSEQCNGYTGADLAALVREAGVLALREFIISEGKSDGNNIAVTTAHFEQAIRKIRPSVTDKDQKHYEKLRKTYSVTQVTTEEEIEDVQMDDA